MGGYVLVNGSGMEWPQADEVTSGARDGAGLLDIECSHGYKVRDLAFHFFLIDRPFPQL